MSTRRKYSGYSWIIASLMLIAGAARAGQPATVATAQSTTYGTYLVDGQGMTLYLFKSDVQGSGKSTCYGGCAYAWPPLLTPVAADAVLPDKLGTIQRKDGTTQVTYNGWPLYYFTPDQTPGDTVGQGADGFGAGWYLVSPEGTMIPAE